MSTRKQQLESIAPEEVRARKTRLVEGGIVFVLVLGVCIYLGIHFARQPVNEPVAAVSTTQHESAPAIANGGREPAVVIVSTSTELPVADGEPPLGGGVPAAVEAPLAPTVVVRVTYADADRAFRDAAYEEAADLFAAYSADHPDDVWGRYMHGLSLGKNGRAAEARSAFDTALELQSDHLKSLVNLARVELELAEPAAALSTIERALDIAPQDAEVIRVLGRCYHELQRADEAAAAYVQALRLRGDDPWTLNNLGLIHIERGEFERALPPLARAAELAPDLAVVRNNLGTALERAGHPSQALAQFESAARLGSVHGEQNLARLDQVILPADERSADLPALAATWTLPAESAPAVAAVMPAPTEPQRAP